MKSEYEICLGIDVGKWTHHFFAIRAQTGEILLNEKISQNESEIRQVFNALKAQGSLMAVVDQPGSMSAILLATARNMGINVGFITPKAMAKAIEMYGNELKSDAHDAMIIAEVAAGLPKLVKPICEKDEVITELYVLMTHDRRLSEDVTRTSNRIHDLLLSSCPYLEAYMKGKRIQSNLCLMILMRFGGTQGLTNAGRANVRRWAKSKSGFGDIALKKIDELYSAASSQSVTVPGQTSIETLIKSEARRLAAVLEERKQIEQRRSEILSRLPEAQLLMSMPGVGEITCATFLSEIGDINRFDSAAKLASYAGLAPRVRQSGTTIHSTTKPKGGNRRLKRVLVLSASKSILFCDESKAYYERKRSEGKCYNSAVTALARRRLTIMYAMLKTGTEYRKKNG